MNSAENNRICHLVLAGEGSPDASLLSAGDFVIAVDGGYSKCLGAGISPGLAVGDFDSLGYVPETCPVVELNPVKDDTDTFRAVDAGFERGFRRFVLHCALGGRFSHELANVSALESIRKRGGSGILLGVRSSARIIEGRAGFGAGGYLSLFPLGGTAEVEIENCRYSGRFVLETDSSLGISNEPLDGASVTVVRGTVLAVTEAPDGQAHSNVIAF